MRGPTVLRYRDFICGLALACCTVSHSVWAGHGFMNSFGDIEWLPTPGVLASERWYPLDNGIERWCLFANSIANDGVREALVYAREKLAELIDAIRNSDAEAAARAADAYSARIERAITNANRAAGVQDARRLRLATALLEHLYIVSIEYTDLPLDVREQVLDAFFADTIHRYENVREALPQAVREQLFFKEEEVRWSIDMTEQADAQRITNDSLP